MNDWNPHPRAVLVALALAGFTALCGVVTAGHLLDEPVSSFGESAGPPETQNLYASDSYGFVPGIHCGYPIALRPKPSRIREATTRFAETQAGTIRECGRLIDRKLRSAAKTSGAGAVAYLSAGGVLLVSDRRRRP